MLSIQEQEAALDRIVERVRGERIREVIRAAIDGPPLNPETLKRIQDGFNEAVKNADSHWRQPIFVVEPERVPLVGSYGGAIVIVSDRVEVWEKHDLGPAAVYCHGRYPVHAGSIQDCAEEEVLHHYGRAVAFGIWECLDEEFEGPVPSFDSPQIWVSRCDGFAPEVEE